MALGFGIEVVQDLPGARRRLLVEQHVQKQILGAGVHGALQGGGGGLTFGPVELAAQQRRGHALVTDGQPLEQTVR